MFPLLGKTCTTPMGIRKAQAFTIRVSGLELTYIILWGSLRLCASLSLDDIIARSLSEVPIRDAIEQIKMYVHKNARSKGRQKNPNRQAIRKKKLGIRIKKG